MKRAIQRLVALMQRPRTAAEEVQQRHLEWDRDCRARGMTPREQADELQIRCAWVRLRRKGSEAVLRRPSRYLEILDRIAADEARTLTAICGGDLAAVFLRAYETTEPLEILSPQAVAAVLARSGGKGAPIVAAPSLVPDLPVTEPRGRRRQRSKVTAF
ncbi:MAG: hypothetical protein IT539_14160 [Bradyrhizobiaceae bacterium]|nr:hypothetical protein [Bradyrhizobiaceae bacterium]